MGFVEGLSDVTYCNDCSTRLPADCTCNCMLGQLRRRIDVLERALLVHDADTQAHPNKNANAAMASLRQGKADE